MPSQPSQQLIEKTYIQYTGKKRGETWVKTALAVFVVVLFATVYVLYESESARKSYTEKISGVSSLVTLPTP